AFEPAMAFATEFSDAARLLGNRPHRMQPDFAMPCERRFAVVVHDHLHHPLLRPAMVMDVCGRDAQLGRDVAIARPAKAVLDEEAGRGPLYSFAHLVALRVARRSPHDSPQPEASPVVERHRMRSSL